jgi:threonine synthase
MINAHRSGSAVVRDRDAIAKPQGIAHAILSGDPGKAYNYVKNVVDESRGDFVAANENEIIVSRLLLAETEGIDACNSTSAAVAGLSRARQSGQVGANDTVLVNLCGKDQAGSGVTSVRWLRKDGESWKPEQQDPTIPPGASAGD